MKGRLRRGAVLTAATLALCGLFALPAIGADGINIDYVEVNGEGVITTLLAVDGLPDGTSADLESISVKVEREPVEVTAEPIEAGDIDRTVVLALDASRSMTGARFTAAKTAAEAFLDAAPADLRVGLLTFSGDVHDVTQPTTDHEGLADVIDGIELTRGTHVYDAVVRAVTLAGNQGARSVLVLSDGQDEGDGTPLGDAVEAATTGGVVVDVVAIAQAPRDLALLARIADGSGGRVIAADDPQALEAVFTAQADALDTQLLVRFPRPKDVAEEASISVSLEADGKTYTDTVFVPLVRAAAKSVPVAVEAKEPLVGKTGLWLGGVTLAIGLAAVLAVVFLGGPRQPSLAQRQIAHYSADRHGHPGPRAQSASPSLVTTAVSITEKMVKGDFETRLSQKLNGAGLTLTAAEWLLLHAGMAVAAGFVGFVLGGPALLFVLLVAGAVLPWFFLKVKHSRRLASFNAQLAETLQLLSGGLSAGLSLAQAIDTVVREGQDPMASEMHRALIEQRLGVEVEDALDGVADRMVSDDFGWVVMGIRIQREVGGNLAELLLTVSDTLREREYLRRQVRVLSAEGRISAYVLGGLPIMMLLYMMLVRPDAVRPLYTEPIGLLLSLIGVVLLLGGFFTLFKLVKVEV